MMKEFSAHDEDLEVRNEHEECEDHHRAEMERVGQLVQHVVAVLGGLGQHVVLVVGTRAALPAFVDVVVRVVVVSMVQQGVHLESKFTQ